MNSGTRADSVYGARKGMVTGTLPAAAPEVKTSLTTRRRRAAENDEYAAFARRVLAAWARRVAAGDIDAITDMASAARDLDDAMRQAVAGLRGKGYSWAEIAARLGVTRQAAQQRWGGSHRDAVRGDGNLPGLGAAVTARPCCLIVTAAGCLPSGGHDAPLARSATGRQAPGLRTPSRNGTGALPGTRRFSSREGNQRAARCGVPRAARRPSVTAGRQPRPRHHPEEGTHLVNVYPAHHNGGGPR